MIIEFSITNFRSIKEKQTFSLVAETTKSKRESNTFDIELSAGNNIRLLRSAVIYGANASGKSNFIRAFSQLRNFIVYSSQFEASEGIELYSPFLFDVSTREAPTIFECTFIGYDNIKYDYTISFNQTYILHEELNYYPKQIKKNLYKRVVDSEEELSDTVKFGTDVNNEEDNNVLFSQLKIFKNQAILSKFGRDIPHTHLTKIYFYFSSWRIWDTSNSEGINRLTASIINNIIPGKDSSFFQRLERLIKATDTKVNGLILKGNKDQDVSRARNDIRRAASRLFGKHIVFDNNKQADYHELPFVEESSGTKVLFALGALILDAIENGGMVIFDELDNSLHPRLSRFLVKIFNNEQFNTKNAQIIFSSHEANLMDKEIFRSDQIWFAEKDDKGATEIYSAQDFEGVREDISFEKWYLSGKFGAIPHTNEIAYIFNDAQEATPLS